MVTLSRTRASLAVFLLALVVSGISLGHRRQLGAMGGMTDEWYLLGANLSAFGTLGLGDEPIVTRPPGYPMFIALALRTLAGSPGKPTFEAYLDRGTHAVYLSQALLLAGSAALFTWWVAEWTGSLLALLLGLAFGVNPYTVVLVGLLHYDLLHIFLLLASSMALEGALQTSRARGLALLAVGGLWGLTTLVRPLTLILPPILLVALWFHPRSGRRRVLADVALLSLGMVLILAPYTWRNHRVSGRWIPVNAQGWVALWASTAEPLGFDPNHYYWDDLLHRHFLPVFSRVTGEPTYSYPAYNRHQGALQSAFREEALQNLREKPGVYLHNVARSAVLLHVALNTVFVDVFREFQDPARIQARGWYFGANPRPYRPTPVARAVSWLYAVFTWLAAAGVVRGLARRERALLVPAAVWLCLAAGHALTYVDVMYLYLRLPFLFTFAAYGLAGAGRELRGGARPVSVGVLIAAALAAMSVGLTMAMVMRPSAES